MKALILALVATFAIGAATADAQSRKLTGTRYFDVLSGATVTVTTVNATSADVGTAVVDHLRVTNATAITASADLDKADLQAASFWSVNTTAGAVDLDFGDDAAMDAADVGSRKLFVVTTGHATQALTVTAGASGVTTITTLNTLGTTCEDAGDLIECIVRSTTAATCVTVCAD